MSPRTYAQKYYAKHKTRLRKAARRRYRERQKELNKNARKRYALRENRRKYYNEHKEIIAERSRLYRKKHKTKIKQRHRQYYEKNKARIYTRTRSYAAAHPDQTRAYRKKSAYKRAGNTPLRKKPRLCEACNLRRASDSDHCHKTKKWRGWLCRKCNLAAGLLNDDRALVLRLAEYLS
jgi:hypothetical protein